MLRILLFSIFLTSFHSAYSSTIFSSSSPNIYSSGIVYPSSPSGVIKGTYSTSSDTIIKGTYSYYSMELPSIECKYQGIVVSTAVGEEGDKCICFRSGEYQKAICDKPSIIRGYQVVDALYPLLPKRWFREGDRNNANLISLIDGTNDGSYYRIWQAIDNGDGRYSQLSINELNDLINFENDESYLDIYSQDDNVTLYYLIEFIDDNGGDTLYCSAIQATMLGQGPSIDLDAAEKYCMDQCPYGMNCK